MSAPRPIIRGLVYLCAALAALTLGALLLAARIEGGRPRSIILVVACVAAAAGLGVLGVRAFSRRERDPAAPDYRHMGRLFAGTLIAMGALGLLLDALVPASYGLIGPYRGQALDVAAVGQPRHLGEPACVDCHDKQVTLHDKDAHARVPCESCHGPGKEHAAFFKSPAGQVADLPDTAIPAGARMLVRKQRQWCLRCHEVDPARPGAFPQIVWSEHMRVSGVADPSILESGDASQGTLPCTTCHDPHEPLFMDRDLRTARLHPLVHRCEDCHGRDDQQLLATPPPAKHPVTFECKYCHGTVAEEFTRSPHKELDCTTCHVYFTESSFAGRIIKDADPRFCLLCHQKVDYRRADGPKMIRWPSHREAMKRDEQDTRQQCIECHRPQMHYPAPPKAEVDVDALFDDEPEDKPKVPDDKKPDDAKPDDTKPDDKKPDDKKPDTKEGEP